MPNISISPNKYVLSDYSNNILVSVNLDKFINAVEQSSPEAHISVNTSSDSYSGKKIQNAIDFIIRNGESNNPHDYMEPILANISHDKINIINGRHRLAAYKILGFKNTYIEIPKYQKDLFLKFK